MYHSFLSQIGIDAKVAILKKRYFNKKVVFYLIFAVLCLFLSLTSSVAQTTDSTLKNNIDSSASINNTKPPKIKYSHSPGKAALMSALLPGLGQIYNKKYWKVPIIYAGFAGLIYAFAFDQSQYIIFRNGYEYFLVNGTVPSNLSAYSSSDLNSLQQYYDHYRQLSAIGIGLLYALNIIDASVDGHMFSFSADDDLSFNIHPTIINTVNLYHYQAGLSLNIKF